jgi:hypothetical protein
MAKTWDRVRLTMEKLVLEKEGTTRNGSEEEPKDERF